MMKNASMILAWVAVLAMAGTTFANVMVTVSGPVHSVLVQPNIEF